MLLEVRSDAFYCFCSFQGGHYSVFAGGVLCLLSSPEIAEVAPLELGINTLINYF